MKGAYVLNKLLEYSKLNGKSFSEKIGLIRPQAIYDIQNGKTQNISVSMANKIISAFPEVNKSWLFTGDGEMLIRPEDKITEKRGIPFYDINVTASIAESFNDIPEVSQYLISYPPLNDCCAAFPVYGESMEPDFFAGEVVLVKEITNVDSMLWGEPYLVITNANCDNLRTIKNVYLSEDRCKFIFAGHEPAVLRRYDYRQKRCPENISY